MLTLKVLSLLLSYPEAETLTALDEMAEVIEQEKGLPKRHKKPVLALINSYRGANLLHNLLYSTEKPGYLQNRTDFAHHSR